MGRHEAMADREPEDRGWPGPLPRPRRGRMMQESEIGGQLSCGIVGMLRSSEGKKIDRPRKKKLGGWRWGMLVFRGQGGCDPFSVISLRTG